MRAKTPRRQAARVSPRARNPAETLSDADILAASDHHERGLLCLRVLSLGQWTAEEDRLRRLWGVTDSGLRHYRRSAGVARAAVQGEDAGKRLDLVLASFRRQEERQEELAEFFRARGRPALASRHDDLQRKATLAFAEIAGLNERRVVVSIEADPRVAGMYQAILAALADRDRQEDEQRRAVLVIVERLNGGTLPADFPEALPSVRDHVRDAVKRYEAEIGARQLPSKP